MSVRLAPELRSRSIGGRRSSHRSFVAFAALVSFGTTPFAQGVLVSTSQTVAATSSLAEVDDSTLVYSDGVTARRQFGEEHWLGVAGRIPGDVDGLARRPGFDAKSYRSLAFTLQSDEGGFLDGDVLAVAPGGGFEALLFESDVQTALGTSGAIDLDALAYDDQGRLLFSLQANLATSALGPIDDGDVLRLDGGVVERLFTEADVQAAVSAATGSASAISDVLGLDVVGGEVWVSVQSPSANDGSVIALGAVPFVVFDEATLGLGGAELDAFVAADASEMLGRLELSVATASPGDTLVATFEGGGAGHPLMALVSGNAGYFDTAGLLAGFGGVFVDLNDPWLNGHLPVPVVLLDGSGTYSTSLVLPPGNFGGAGFEGEPGWTFQFIDLFTLEVSAPSRVAM